MTKTEEFFNFKKPRYREFKRTIILIKIVPRIFLFLFLSFFFSFFLFFNFIKYRDNTLYEQRDVPSTPSN